MIPDIVKGSLLEVGIEIGRKTGGGTRTGKGKGTMREIGAGKEKRIGTGKSGIEIEAGIEIEKGIEMGKGKGKGIGIVTIRIGTVIERGNGVREGTVEEAEMKMMIITGAEITRGN